MKETVVAAPMAGVVAYRSVNLGQMVSPGVPLMTLEDVSSVYAMVNVKQMDLPQVKEGLAVQVMPSDDEKKVLSGEVSLISPVANQAARVFEARVKVKNDSGILKPGMFVKTRITLGSPVDVVMNSLGYENLEAPVGNITTNDRKISLRTSGKLQKMADFNNIPIAKRGGVQLYIRDIAKVMSGVKDPESISFFQGKPSIGVDVIKQSGSNTVIVADDVRKVVEELKPTLPEGGILAILTVLLFMGNWRTTIISAIAIPTSIISTFFAMRVLGYTLNMMSLMALSLSVGLLIDDAIVVIENIERHLRMGKSPLEAAKDATSEIGLAVMATTFTLMAVFLPLGMMNGITGKFFKQFGITVVVAVLVSLLVSFTLVPLFSSRYLKQQEKRKARGPFGKFLDWLPVPYILFIVERLSVNIGRATITMMCV
nr:efflux RND transporter permease subunit [Desulfosporosinus metallidurans]